MEKQPAVYIMANKRNGTLYTGVTSDLCKRVWEHKAGEVNGFSKHYDAHLLVWFEVHSTMPAAIQREKQIKKWNRVWKLHMIEKQNPY